MEPPTTNPHWRWAFIDLINPDSETRFSAFGCLQNHINRIDSNDQVLEFLTQLLYLYATNGKNYLETLIYLLSLLDSLSCSHGRLLVPWIPEITAMVLESLSYDSPPPSILIDSCSNLVNSLVIHSSDREEGAEIVIRSLSGCLLRSLSSSSMASAICLRVLVETEKWKIAPSDLVNAICSRFTGELQEKGTQTSFHIDLVSSLAKKNEFILEAYGRSLLKSAAEILENSMGEEDSEKIYAAVGMINCIVKFTDVSVLSSEISNCVRVMTKHCSNQGPKFENLVAETMRLVEFALPMLNISSIEEQEQVGSIDSWVSPRAPISSYCCNAKFCGYCELETEKNKNRNNGKSMIHDCYRSKNFRSRPDSEIPICRKLVCWKKISTEDGYNDSNSKSGSRSSDSIGSSMSFSSSNTSIFEIMEPSVLEIANGGSVGWMELKKFKEGILWGLGFAGFSLCAAMVVGSLIESREVIGDLIPT